MRLSVCLVVHLRQANFTKTSIGTRIQHGVSDQSFTFTQSALSVGVGILSGTSRSDIRFTKTAAGIGILSGVSTQVFSATKLDRCRIRLGDSDVDLSSIFEQTAVLASAFCLAYLQQDLNFTKTSPASGYAQRQQLSPQTWCKHPRKETLSLPPCRQFEQTSTGAAILWIPPPCGDVGQTVTLY